MAHCEQRAVALERQTRTWRRAVRHGQRKLTEALLECVHGPLSVVCLWTEGDHFQDRLLCDD
jgi:hypothetical protein